MKKSFWRFFIITITLACTGCATALTQIGPAKPRIIDGETRLGEVSHYNHRFHTQENIILLEKTPMCYEMQEKKRLMQKVPRGLLLTIPEVAFYGLGLVDAITAFAIVEASKSEMFLAEFATSDTIQCGEGTASTNEPLIIYSEDKSVERRAVTDDNGTVDLNAVFPELSGVVQLVIEHERHGAPTLLYEYDAGL